MRVQLCVKPDVNMTIFEKKKLNEFEGKRNQTTYHDEG